MIANLEKVPTTIDLQALTHSHFPNKNKAYQENLMNCLNCKVPCQHDLSVNHKNVIVPLFPENEKHHKLTSFSPWN